MSGACEVEDGVTEYCRGCGKLKREHPGYPYNQKKPEARKFGVGFLVRTVNQGIVGRVEQISNTHSNLYWVGHVSPHGFSRRWYEREELELAVTDPHAWLLASLVLRWNPQDAKVLADACEERGNHGAASVLREDVSLRTRQIIEHLAMIVGVKAFDESVRNTWQSTTDYRIGWSHTLDGRPFEDIIGGTVIKRAAHPNVAGDVTTLVTGDDGRVMSGVTGRIVDVRPVTQFGTPHRSAIRIAIDNVDLPIDWMNRPVMEGSVIRTMTVTNGDIRPVPHVSIYVKLGLFPT